MFSPDASRIVTASTDKTARIWDAKTGAQLAVLSGHGKLLTFAAYSPDGADIVTTSSDKTARIWDANTGALRAVLAGHGDSVRSAAYSPDGKRIVTSSYDKTARIWDAHSGEQLAVLTGHSGYVHFAAFSPDGTRIVTASYDRTAGIWDARTGAQLAALSSYGGGIYTAVYSPDGSRIVTAARDKTVRIWDARIPATLSAQILWAASAETDPLADFDRNQLGLPPDYREKSWPPHATACDQDAAAIYDPDRVTPGISVESIATDSAILACSAEISLRQHAARSDYQMGRVLAAKGDASGARREFEIAAAKNYRAARVDLADLLDPDHAVSLYEQAWQQAVPIAAFKLGQHYEFGVHPDQAEAWRWYQRAADAGEPNAFARFAERDERNALGETDAGKRNAQLFAAFTLYAAAAERARLEDWPDDAWKSWRYRRATLARILAHEDMMQQVANAYGDVLARWNPNSRSSGQRIEGKFDR
jgi:TPR repeat protein